MQQPLSSNLCNLSPNSSYLLCIFLSWHNTISQIEVCWLLKKQELCRSYQATDWLRHNFSREGNFLGIDVAVLICAHLMLCIVRSTFIPPTLSSLHRRMFFGIVSQSGMTHSFRGLLILKEWWKMSFFELWLPSHANLVVHGKSVELVKYSFLHTNCLDLTLLRFDWRPT